MSGAVPVIRQLEDADCGAACLAMVLDYFGGHRDLRELRELTGAGRDGVSALAIVRAARACGLRARGVRADLGDLKHLPRGSILHWEFNHFVVFERTTRTGIRVIDPAHGRRVVSGEELARAYTGVAVVTEPGEAFGRGKAHGQGTWRYLRPMLGQVRNMGRVVATSLVIRLAALGLPLLTALVVDEIVPRNDHRLLLVFTLGVAMIIGYSFLSSFLRANVLLELQTRLDMGLTLGFLDHLVKLPYSFFLRRSSGDLMMRLQSNTAVRDILATGTMSAVLDGAFASVYLLLLFVISPVLGAMVLALALCEIATMLLSWRRGQRLMSGSLQAQADTQSYAYEMLAGIETLKASGAEHRAADRWAGLFTSQVNLDLTRGRLGAAVGDEYPAGRRASGHPHGRDLSSARRTAVARHHAERRRPRRRVPHPAGQPGGQRPTVAATAQLHATHQRRPGHSARAAGPARSPGLTAQRPYPGPGRVVLVRHRGPRGGQSGQPRNRARPACGHRGPVRVG
jgi:ABC-type bacteriocin/lantibiotic exporter with double-glycine peptidase domain